MDALKLCGLFLSLLLTVHIGNGDINTRPDNTADEETKKTTLRCYSQTSDTDPDPQLQWDISRDGGQSWVTVSRGSESLDPHYEVETNDTIYGAARGVYNLVIRDLVSEDAIMYKCNEWRSSQNAYAYVIVLNSYMRCYANTTLTDLVDGETIRLSCTANYQGLYAPSIVWIDNTGAGYTPINATTDSVVDYSLIYTVSEDQNDNNRQFQATMLFGAPPEGAIPEDTSQDIYARNAPSYEFPYVFDQLYVQYKPRNMQITERKDEYNPGEIITCSADSRPNAEFTWINTITNETMDGNQLQITEDMEGTGLSYKCVASNEIRDVEYEISDMLSFSVTIPTTTTTTTPLPTTTTTAASTEEPSDDGLSTGAIVGIVFGVLIFLILLAVLLFYCCFRKAPTKAKSPKDKKKSHFDGVDAVRQPYPPADGKPSDIAFVSEKPPPYNPYAPPIDRNVEGLMYGDLALDDTPRSRKPIQVYEPSNYDDIRRV